MITLKGLWVVAICSVCAANAESLNELRKVESTVLSIKEQITAATVSFDLGDGMSGSGVVVSRDGLMMSAAHVTQEVGKTFEVVFEDGRRHSATALGLDSSTDAALARLEREENDSFPYVEIEREEKLSLGDWVVAMGHAGGFDFDRGSVLRIGRVLESSSTILKTDCTLIGGDSGGPLFNLSGRLVGIHSRVGKVTTTNLHVPIRQFDVYWDEMMNGEFLGEGPYAHPSKRIFGMKLIPFDSQLFVETVEEDSLSAKAGVSERALLLSVNGQSVKSLSELNDVISRIEEETAVSEGVLFTFQDVDENEEIMIKGAL